MAIESHKTRRKGGDGMKYLGKEDLLLFDEVLSAHIDFELMAIPARHRRRFKRWAMEVRARIRKEVEVIDSLQGVTVVQWLN